MEDNHSLLAMVNRRDLHVAFTRNRANARMFVQDTSVLRRVANRSLIKNVTARNLELRKIATFVERIEEMLAQAGCLPSRLTADAQRRHERIRGLRLKKQRAKARARWREQNRAAEISL